MDFQKFFQDVFEKSDDKYFAWSKGMCKSKLKKKKNSTGKLQSVAINFKKKLSCRDNKVQNLLVHINAHEGRVVLQPQ